ncbi:MAG: hypothetical protein LH617_11180 [Ramlibacter sp.]|nr:hypothetical protein [Ramlibacter sp.]
MLSRTFNQIAQSPWAKLIWAGIALLALIQVVAFYRLCISQVERAQARETVAVDQRNALNDCLDFQRKSTISSCNRRATAQTVSDTNSLSARDMPRTRSSNQTVFSGAVPVGYVFH